MTTLEVAEAIAYAVLEDAYDSGRGFSWEDTEKAAPAVLATLRKHHVWFCKLQENVHGDIVSSQQMELWP